jgi:hypothetical protein
MLLVACVFGMICERAMLVAVPGNCGPASGYSEEEELYLLSVKLGKGYGWYTPQLVLQSLTNQGEPHKLHAFYSESKKRGKFFPAVSRLPSSINQAKGIMVS